MQIDPAAIARECQSGIEYVMDGRDLVQHLHDFLVQRSASYNAFIVPLLDPTCPLAKTGWTHRVELPLSFKASVEPVVRLIPLALRLLQMREVTIVARKPR